MEFSCASQNQNEPSLDIILKLFYHKILTLGDVTPAENFNIVA